MQIKEEFKPI